MKGRIFFAIALLVSFVKTQGQSSAKDSEIPLAISYFSTEENLAPREVLKSEFTPVGLQTLNLGATNKTHWIKVEIPPIGHPEKYYLVVDYPLIDFLNVYDFTYGQPLLIERTGQHKPFQSREYNFKNFIFPIRNFIGDESRQILLEIRSGKQILLPIVIRPEQDIIQLNGQNNLIAGFYTGLILVMLLYNLFIYTTTGDQNYLYYVIYIFFLGLTQAALQGFGDMFLWPDSAWLSVNGTQLFGALVGISSIIFVKFFLHIRRFLPKYNLLFNICIGIDTLAILLLFAGFPILSYNLINLVAAFASILGIASAIIIARKGNRSAIFFLVAFSMFIIGIFIYVLKDFGVLPFNRFTNNALLIGSGVEVVLLSFALADKINTYRHRMQESQGKALEALRENERIVREQNLLLEKKVNERTHDLINANNELSETLRNLREAQGQLVEAEKMASLGQLTAGIAHEINNPINFISANISPIKNDVNDIFSAFDELDMEVRKSENEQLIKKAEEIKEEFDIEYAREELDSLLKGMKDGVDRTVEIVRGLRVFSRLDEAIFKPVDLVEGIESTLVLLNNKIKGTINVVKDFDPELPEVECYGGKINQVFMNLIVNSIQAITENKEQQEPGEIKIAIKRLGNKVQVRIGDNGPGIPKEIQEKIFDPFFTTKPIGKGTGLGLSIVYQIINAHNGSLKLESEVGKGTEFIITLPIENQPQAA